MFIQNTNVHFKFLKFKFIERPIYITGESYAGHYIPAISAYVHK